MSHSSTSPLPSAQLSGLGISFSNVEKRYGPVRALRPTTLEIHPGEFIALLGPNGSGKSTLLRLTAQLARPTSGSIRFRGPAGDESAAAARRRLGVVAHATMLYDELTAEENLQLFARLYQLSDAPAVISVRLEAAGLAARRTDLVRTFSRGMRQRLTLARALLHGPALLLLDEPTTGLDSAGCDWLARELRLFHQSGCTILMSTHQGGEVLSLATRTLSLDSGRIVGDTSSRTGITACAPSSVRPGASA
jgi:ABC-type multidrug transport system ATPase subunit